MIAGAEAAIAAVTAVARMREDLNIVIT